MASEYLFRRIIGVEFSEELGAIAQENILRYKSASQRCRDISLMCADFTQYPIPRDPLFVFLYNPSSREVTSQLVRNIALSLGQNPRELWVLYVTPFYDVLESDDLLKRRKIRSNVKYALYLNLPAKSLSALNEDRALTGGMPLE